MRRLLHIWAEDPLLFISFTTATMALF